MIKTTKEKQKANNGVSKEQKSLSDCGLTLDTMDLRRLCLNIDFLMDFETGMVYIYGRDATLDLDLPMNDFLKFLYHMNRILETNKDIKERYHAKMRECPK